MKVYVRGSKQPLVIETNLEWAIPYWTKRKQANPRIYWRMVCTN
jgi:hypothetical protein